MDRESRELSPHIRPIPTYLSERDRYAAEESDDFFGERSIQDYIRILFKFRWLILSVTAVVVCLTLVRSFLATPLYTATATLKVGTYSPMLSGTGIENVLRQETMERDYLNTQIKLLTSLSLADKVLTDTDVDSWMEKYAQKHAGIFSVFTPFWQQFTGGNETDAPASEPVDESYSFPLGKLRSYLAPIEVAPIEKTSLVRVTVTTPNPVLSAKIANTHAQSFIELARVERQQNTLDNLVFLKAQAEELAGKVAIAERDIASYAEENAIVSLNKDENIVVRRMSELNQLLTEATAARITAEQTYKEALSGSGLKSSAYDDDSVKSIRIQLKQAEGEYARLGKKFKDTYPRMQELKAQINSLKENLNSQRQESVAALEARYNAAKQTENELSEQLEVQKSKTFDLSRRQVQYNIMKREYDSLRDLHQSVLRQLKEAQLSAESSGTNIVLSDRAAVPATHSSPQRFKNFVLSLIFGPLIGIGLALVLESMDNTLKTPDDVQRALNLPALGVVPLFESDDSEDPLIKHALEHHKQDSPEGESSEARALRVREHDLDAEDYYPTKLITTTSPRSISSEAFRTIRTGILLSSADNPPKVILVTSGKKAEGKTTLVSNLAVTLAQSSHKTILIDADLRRPSVHTRFHFDPTEPGLVDFLTHQKPLKNVVRPTQVDNLSVITAGPIPPNPAELVGSKTMAQLLQDLSEIYDYVLVDSPPVLPVTDAAMLSRVVDGVVLVVRGQDTHKKLAQDAAKRLRQVGAHVLGVVLNDVDFKRGDYYYYYRDTYTYYDEDDDRRTARRRSRRASG